jgi:hypothetical protein
MKWKEKRKLERFVLELPAQISSMSSNVEDKIEVETSNICSGGAFFKMLRPLPVGTAVRITLHLSLSRFDSLKDYCRSSQIQMTGKVSRCEQSGMSVLFDTEYQIHPFTDKNASALK